MDELLDAKIDANSAIAWSCWAVGVLFVLLDLLKEAALGHAGILLGAAGATLQIRGFLAHLHDREVAAFELGRKTTTVRSVR